MMSPLDSNDLKSAVRNRYARAAVEVSRGCCEASCCEPTQKGTDEIGRGIGYDDRELASLPPDSNLGLGCGNPTAIAGISDGQTVLDLGAGAGIDCFLAAERVGPTGRVIGVDMTPEMIERARRNAAKGGFANVEFRLGEIEALPVADGSVDVIISNCVLNLVPDKARALAEAHRVLKPGGRFVISDLVSDHAVPGILQDDLDAAAGCLPTLRSTYLQQMKDAGFPDALITEEAPYPASYILDDPGVRAFVAEHPDGLDELAAFAGSIAAAHFEATRA